VQEKPVNKPALHAQIEERIAGKEKGGKRQLFAAPVREQETEGGQTCREHTEEKEAEKGREPQIGTAESEQFHIARAEEAQMKAGVKEERRKDKTEQKAKVRNHEPREQGDEEEQVRDASRSEIGDGKQRQKDRERRKL
jgi:hypothetical protein